MKNYRKLLIIILVFFPLYGQVTISGSVTNEDGKILPGANILLKGTNLGVVSDQEGQFILNIPKDYYINSHGEINVSYIGYNTKIIIIP